MGVLRAASQRVARYIPQCTARCRLYIPQPPVYFVLRGPSHHGTTAHGSNANDSNICVQTQKPKGAVCGMRCDARCVSTKEQGGACVFCLL
jgi:hypothetical protein